MNGVADGSSAEAFADNVGALIATLRQDWAAGGNVADDLSFTLLGMYDIAGSPAGRDPQLAGYAAALGEMAEADSQLTFVDLYAVAPSYEEAAAAGYIADGIHLERTGALEYGRLVMDAIVPEPGSLSLVAVGALSLLRRRPRCKRPAGTFRVH